MMTAARARESTGPLLLLALSLPFTLTVFRNFSDPLVGFGDTDLWLQMVDYFSRHLSLMPLPQLDLVNDDALYPWGVSQVFRPWVFEAGYFHHIATSLLGRGPWLQLYYVLSVVGCGLMTYIVVRREFGWVQGLAGGVVVSYANFPALIRYPAHFSFAVVHWLTLSLLLDFVILRRVVLRHPISARLLLAKTAAVLLCFGHELGYLCGMALTSTMVMGTSAVLITGRRHGWSRKSWMGIAERMNHHLRSTARQYAGVTSLLSTVVVGSAVLYLPLVFQLLFAVHDVDTSGGGIGRFFTSPARVLLPVLPDSLNVALSGVFGRGIAGEPVNFRPGFYFIVLGILVLRGFRVSRRSRRLLVPLLILLTLHLAYVRGASPLNLLPWCEQARANDRFGVACCVLFFCLFLSIPQHVLRSVSARRVLSVAALVFAVETTLAWSSLAHRTQYMWSPDPSFFELGEVVAKAPGEAVMEWPFIVCAGNGGGAEFVAYFRRLSGVQSLQAIHHKKVMGGTYGRLYPSQVEPLRSANLHRLMLPDDAGLRQRRNFTKQEWQFLEQFFRTNGFCGVVLYTDMLPETTVAGFHRRFGPPRATTEVPNVGRIEFISRREDWLDDVNRDAGRRVLFDSADGATNQNVVTAAQQERSIRPPRHTATESADAAVRPAGYTP